MPTSTVHSAQLHAPSGPESTSTLNEKGSQLSMNAHQRRVGPAWLAIARWVAIAATFVNLGIHLALAPTHIDEMLYVGVLFVIASLVLGAVMVGLASDRDSMRTPAWVVGSLVCGLEFMLFVISRTSGLPLGFHETWTGSSEDLLGLASLFVELVFIVCAVESLSLRPRGQPRPRVVAWLPWYDRTAPLS